MGRRNRESIQVGDLRDGDVVLFKGSGFESWAIMYLDGGRHSHAALYVGRPGGSSEPAIAEATRKGVMSTPLQERLDSEEHADVYRWHAPDGTTLGSPGYPAGPILKVADRYVTAHSKYAYDELAFVTCLLVAKDLKVPQRWRLLMAHAFWLLEAWKEQDRTMVVCSELVYRCFSEASPGDRYRLDVAQKFLKKAPLPAGERVEVSVSKIDRSLARLGLGVSSDHLDRHLEQAARTSLAHHGVENHQEALRQSLEDPGLEEKVRAALPVFADFVTPEMLHESRSLRCVGRLK